MLQPQQTYKGYKQAEPQAHISSKATAPKAGA